MSGKTTTHFFLIFQKSAKKSTKKLYSWHALGLSKQIKNFKTDYRFLWLLSLHCFFLTLITLLFICIIPCIHICFYYSLILCFYFHLLFLNLLATKHILQVTMFHIISLETARNITEIRNTS